MFCTPGLHRAAGVRGGRVRQLAGVELLMISARLCGGDVGRVNESIDLHSRGGGLAYCIPPCCSAGTYLRDDICGELSGVLIKSASVSEVLGLAIWES